MCLFSCICISGTVCEYPPLSWRHKDMHTQNWHTNLHLNLTFIILTSSSPLFLPLHLSIIETESSSILEMYVNSQSLVENSDTFTCVFSWIPASRWKYKKPCHSQKLWVPSAGHLPCVQAPLWKYQRPHLTQSQRLCASACVWLVFVCVCVLFWLQTETRSEHRAREVASRFSRHFVSENRQSESEKTRRKVSVFKYSCAVFWVRDVGCFAVWIQGVIIFAHCTRC